MNTVDERLARLHKEKSKFIGEYMENAFGFFCVLVLGPAATVLAILGTEPLWIILAAAIVFDLMIPWGFMQTIKSHKDFRGIKQEIKLLETGI